MLFCVNFGTHHEFDRRLIYNNLLFFPVSVSAMLPLFFKQECLALSSKKMKAETRFPPYSRNTYKAHFA